jgi:hypothetical protein
MIALPVMLVWLVVMLILMNQGPKELDYKDLFKDVSTLEIREDLFRTSVSSRGTSPAFDDALYINPHHQFDTSLTNDPIKILVLGDSYTYGWGLLDSSRRWVEQLERGFKDEGFSQVEFTVLATPGASVFSYASWAEKVPGSGLFDYVIVASVENDFVPAPFEISRFENLKPIVSDNYKVEQFEANNPNESLIDPSIDKIRKTARQALWVPLYGIDTSSHKNLDKVGQRFEANGFTKIPMFSAKKALDAAPTRNFYAVSRIDHHPNEALNYLYTKDLLSFFSNLLGAPSGSSKATPLPAVSSVLPATAEVVYEKSAIPSEFSLSFYKKSIVCTEIAKQGVSVSCENSKPTYKSSPSSDPTPWQDLPCLPMKSPFAPVFFSNPSTTSLKITMDSNNQDLSLVSLFYDEAAFLGYKPVGLLKDGAQLTLPKGAAGFAVVDFTKSCSASEYATIDDFTLSVSSLP